MPNLNGLGSIFPGSNATKYDWDSKRAYCKEVHGLDLDESFIGRSFDYRNSSRIIFVNGLADPWLVGCVTESLKEDLPVINIEGAAHHLDSFLPRK